MSAPAIVVDDELLLRQYASTRSAEAFAELARRHGDWVYSTAARMIYDRDLAQDVTQAVFLLLSQQPKKALGRKLPAWLFNVTRFTVASTLRAEMRRRKHEQRAANMSHASTVSTPESLWNELSPLLDDFIARLRMPERQAILLRYYQGKSFVDVGHYLGISEEAARKRVNSAVEKLRARFERRGLASMDPAFSAALLIAATHTAPASLMSTLAAPGAQSSSATLLAGAIQKMLFLTKAKAALLGLLLAMIALGTAGAIVVATREALPGNAPAPTAQPPAVANGTGSGIDRIGPGSSNITASQTTPPVNAQTMKYAVNFQLGAAQFSPGDSIAISEVRGSADTISLGNSYQIKGTYTLSSQPAARLSVYVRSTQRGVNDNGPYGQNFVDITKGSGIFSVELHMNIAAGNPHLSFYPTGGGSSFGSLFFGTGDMVAK